MIQPIGILWEIWRLIPGNMGVNLIVVQRDGGIAITQYFPLNSLLSVNLTKTEPSDS